MTRKREEDSYRNDTGGLDESLDLRNSKVGNADGADLCKYYEKEIDLSGHICL